MVDFILKQHSEKKVISLIYKVLTRGGDVDRYDVYERLTFNHDDESILDLSGENLGV